MKTAIASALILASVAGNWTEVITGRVTHVRDGDTLEVDGLPIRLGGIAAPELTETNGPAARDLLVKLAHGAVVMCTLTGERSYDRAIGTCYLEGDIGMNLNEAMVVGGLARDCPRYSSGDYADAEAYAVRTGYDLSATYPLPGYCIPDRSEDDL